MKATIILRIQYRKDEQLEDIIQNLTYDTDGYSSQKHGITMWVDNVLHEKKRRVKR